MGDLTRNFDREEFACKGGNCCGHSAPIRVEVVQALQELRDWLSHEKGVDVPIFVASGFRCRRHDYVEALSRGVAEIFARSRRSQHCLGLAVDIVSPLVGADELAAAAKQIPLFRDGGVGRYTGSRHDMVHVDARPDGPARWTE
jgi:uncharacterized protein YcbK (DUF882 family)